MSIEFMKWVSYIAGGLWSLVVLLSLAMFHNRRPRTEYVKDASLELGGTLSQLIFNVAYWILLFTLLPRMLDGENAKAWAFFFVVIAVAALVRQAARLIRSRGYLSR